MSCIGGQSSSRAAGPQVQALPHVFTAISTAACVNRLRMKSSPATAAPRATRSAARLRALTAFLLVAGLLGCVSGAGRRARESTAPLEAYMRVAHTDADTVSLQIALRRFTPEKRRGPEIWLAGASHIGESNYFAALQRHLD